LCDKSAKKRKGVSHKAKRQVQDKAKKGVKMGCEGKHGNAGRADEPRCGVLGCLGCGVDGVAGNEVAG